MARAKKEFLKEQWAEGSIPQEDNQRVLGEVGVWVAIVDLADNPDELLQELLANE